jgi:hypothetical protein
MRIQRRGYVSAENCQRAADHISKAIQNGDFTDCGIDQNSNRRREKVEMKSKTPIEMKTSIVRITPKMAREWLQTNRNNRHVNANKVSLYAADMMAGRWRLTHQGIAFDENGNLIDGQHRLLAIIKADCEVTMSVSTGVPNDSKWMFDIGNNRRGSHAIEMNGFKNSTALAATINCIKNILGDRYLPPMPNDIMNRVALSMNDEITESIHSVYSKCNAGGIGKKAIYVAIHVLMCRVANRDRVDEIFRKVLAGYGLEPRTRFSIVRNFIMKGNRDGTKFEPQEKNSDSRIARAMITLLTTNNEEAYKVQLKKIRSTFTASQLSMFEHNVGQMELGL